ncbi:MAG: hypothetical protein Q9227_002046 [Pyrenula ochraceoflavens]
MNDRREHRPSNPRKRSRSPSRSPPRQRKRPSSLISANAKAAVEKRQQQRDNLEAASVRGGSVQDLSNQYYNARPEWVKERGREWRRNESKIKGLRGFNNWVKSYIIQKFSPRERIPQEERGWGEEAPDDEVDHLEPLKVLDIGCGKGGDLQKWQLTPEKVGLYVGLDPATQSIQQANDRYRQMRNGRRPIFHAEFLAQDCFGESLGRIPIVREVGFDPNVAPGVISRWSPGGFDIVAMMFCMHYSFENEAKARQMLMNIAGALKKGGKYIGVSPNSDVLSSKAEEYFLKKQMNESKPAATSQESNGTTTKTASEAAPEPDKTTKPTPVEKTSEPNGDSTTPPPPPNPEENPHWGNSIYTVRFVTPTLPLLQNNTLTFRPRFGHKYMYWMDEAVDVPEYVVPWEGFRALAEEYNLELRWRKPFLEIWEDEMVRKGEGEGGGVRGEMGRVAERMGILRRDNGGGGGLAISREEREAVGFYHGFCFVKV